MKQTVLSSIITRQRRREQDRRELIAVAGPALSASKRVIFKLQRQDVAGAAAELEAAQRQFAIGFRLCRRDAALLDQGVWRAAQEEYSEALFMYDFIVHGSIGVSKAITDDPEILIGGLSDFTGELARYAVIKATEGEHEMVERFYCMAEKVVASLLSLDLTGSLRAKFDQAKQHLRKLEDIRYDLSKRA
jgi:predicted translin family RNA/ssDNA-binding protein